MQILPGKYRIQWSGKAGPEWVWLPVEAVVEGETGLNKSTGAFSGQERIAVTGYKSNPYQDQRRAALPKNPRPAMHLRRDVPKALRGAKP